MHRITELGREFGLSRSTLLYYDRLGLFSPTRRDRAGGRRYSELDRERLARICRYRQAGLSLKDIRSLLRLETAGDAREDLLQQRLQSLGDEIRALQAKQRLVAQMLHLKASGWRWAALDKTAWVEMFQAAGMDDEAMDAWHREFEARAPEAHEEFLVSLGIGPAERNGIRQAAGRKA